MSFRVSDPAESSSYEGAEQKFMPRAVALRRDLIEVLEGFQDRARVSHLESPIRQLALNVAQRLQAGEVGFDGLRDLVQLLTSNAFKYRAHRLNHYVGECDLGANQRGLRAMFESMAGDAEGRRLPFAEFRAKLEREAFGIVITAHPTFSVSEDLTRILAELATGIAADGSELSDADVEARVRSVVETRHGSPQQITLEEEQHFALMAIDNIHSALERVYATAVEVARDLYPDDWPSLRPRMLTVASWVGYDLDGRSDIGWATSFYRRLEVAHRQLQRYRDMLARVEAPVGGSLENLRARLAQTAEGYEGELEMLRGNTDEIETVAAFSRHLADDTAERPTEVAPLIGLVEEALASGAGLSDEARAMLCVMAAEMANFGLAFAHTHVRLNASQLTNAVRGLVQLEGSSTEAVDRRRYMRALTELLDEVKPVTINFGSVMGERTSAKRLFMLVAQFLKHVDAAEPVRFLIAECNTPFPVLTALYFARLFGVDHKIDISPLFETPIALLHGHEVVSELLDNPHYRDYVKRRGRLCIQTGFSDAGRYVSQVAASLAIERVRIKLARVLEKKGVEAVELVVFDTHGESIGRGAHPLNFHDRLDHVYPPASRAAFAAAGIPVKQEVSFQGGDGYVYFATPQLAFATVCRLLEHALRPTPADRSANDEFYRDADFSLDFFITVKDFNERLIDNPDYGAMLNLFGPNLLYPTGSRQVKRQHDGQGGVDQAHPSQTRAIPHNALLQQVGYLSNSMSGVGQAIARDQERFAEVLGSSDRLKRLISLVSYARNLSNLDVMDAYVALYDPVVWLRRACVEKDGRRARQMQRLSRLLKNAGRHERLSRVNRIFLNDTLDLDAGLRAGGAEHLLPDFAADCYPDLDLLHAVRIALIHEIFLMITRIPRFSNLQDVTIDEVLDDLLQLDVERAVGVLKRAFPYSHRVMDPAAFGEPATYRSDEERGYEREHHELFDPILEIYDIVRRASAGITHIMGAVG